MLTLPLAQASSSWLTIWLTPIWFLAVGVAMGLIALAVLVLLFRVLAAIPAWEKLSSSPVGHGVAAAITAALAGVTWFFLSDEAKGSAELNEPLLLGIALVLVCSIVGWAIVFCSSSRMAKASVSTLTEGAAGYLGLSVLTIVIIGAVIWGISAVSPSPIVINPAKTFASLPQVFSAGKAEITKPIPGNSDAFVPVELDINFDLLSSIAVQTDKAVVLGDADDAADFIRTPIKLGATESVSWNRTQRIEELPIPYEEGQVLHIQNKEIDEATVTITANTIPPVPEAASLLITALVVVLVGLSILLQQGVAPRVSAVAHATVKNELAQPLFLVLMLLGIVAILLYEFLSFNTFGEDIKLLKDCGITTIMLLAAFQGIWSASSSISEEIEGKTALTILSKPIQRRSFVLGKFMGIFWVLLLMFVILGAVELFAVSYKPIYDAKENSEQLPVWQLCHMEMMSTVPGLAMAFMQSVVLTAISVALATRLPQLANLSICFAIYVIGNLTTSLVSSTQDGFEIVKFVASLVATIIPILEHFSLQAAIDSGNAITMSLLSGNLIYCLLYVLLAMFLALLLFEDRDLA
ncbi:MAG: ABC transporter permease [Pirellulaceae bacterium]